MSKDHNSEFTAPPSDQFESVDCNLCHWPEHRKKYNRFGYQIVKCPNCKLWWVNPRIPQDAVDSIYAERYFEIRKTQNGDNEEDYSFKRLNSIRHLDEIEKYREKGKILDVGCGEGLFLRVAQENGWDIAGVEYSPQAVELANKYIPGKITQGILSDADILNNSFDVVTMFDVIEHVYDPVNELKLINRILKPDGIIYLLTPDCGSIYSKLMGKYWFEIKPREHIYYFSKKTISRLLDLAGFRVRSIKSGGKVLTFKYICQVLRKENPFLASLLRNVTRWSPFYNKSLHFPTGFVVAVGQKKQ